METGDQSFKDLRFSFGQIAGTNGYSAIRDNMSEMMRIDIEVPEQSSPIQYNSTLRVMPDTIWATAYVSAMTTTRTRQLVKDAQDDLVLMVHETDLVLRVPGLEDQYVRAGDALLLSQARESSVLTRSASNVWALKVPYRNIAQMLPQLGSAPLLTIRRESPMLELLDRYGRWLSSEPMADPQSRHLIGRHLQEMMAQIIGGSVEFKKDVAAGTVASVRFKTAQAEMENHLGERYLTLEWLAGQLKVTPRHLRRLFASQGTSFSDVLRQTRLARARAMLEDPRYASRTISAIALECGFPEASALNRLFRQEYSMTPSEMRWHRLTEAGSTVGANARR